MLYDDGPRNMSREKDGYLTNGRFGFQYENDGLYYGWMVDLD